MREFKCRKVYFYCCVTKTADKLFFSACKQTTCSEQARILIFIYIKRYIIGFLAQERDEKTNELNTTKKF